jgi:DNA repair exonuclease SbcCD nuclease subunit
MNKILVVGDPHVTPQDLPDCEALWSLVLDSIEKYEPRNVLLLGDIHNTHDILNTKVIDFWSKAFSGLLGPDVCVTALCGNHDQYSPTIRHPHSLIPYRDICDTIDAPKYSLMLESCAMPYYASPVEFIEEAVKLKEKHPKVDTLFCHQTFSGADEGLGYLTDESVEPSAVPFKTIISGHIHKPMRLGKVWYVGAPRWRTLKDAETPIRHIYVLEDGKEPIAIPTNTHCTRIFKFEDSEEEPLSINLTSDELKLADIRVTINGKPDYISKRSTELKEKYNAKCRGVPTRSRLAKASESEGIENAFARFSNSFSPLNGTPKEVLLKEIYARLG